MSVAFKSRTGEVGGDGWNLMADETKYGRRCQSSVWWIVAAAVCVGLLLLTVILVARNTSAINQWDAKYEKLINNLTAERDELKTQSRNLSQEMELLQSRYDDVVASQNKLQEEVARLNYSRSSLNRTREPCPQGWTRYNSKCYYFSPSGSSKSWDLSRKDCKERGADLAIVHTREELEFVARGHGITWVGLTDKAREDHWKWVDGTDFVNTELWQSGEPNNSDGNEDCAEASRDARALNDVPCSRKFSWVCEK